MSRHRVPADVQTAIQFAREADWKVSIRNEKVVITVPDTDDEGKPNPVNLTIGLNPNTESLKKFLREASTYNLIDGPARTPAEAAKLLAEAEEKGRLEAEEANRQRAEFEATQAKKQAEAKAAAKKAAEATANGLKTMPKPEIRIPAQTAKATGKSIFPAFDKSLVGTTDYPKFQLSDGRFYCIECWSEGVEFTARAPQGLATHRGFRHQMYTGAAAADITTTTQETSRVSLPGDVQDAIDLLRSVIAENLSVPSEDAGKLAELEASLAEVKARAAQDLEKADKDYQELKKNSEESIKVARAKIYQLTEELSGKDGRQQAETESLMKSFQGLLGDIHKAINELSPIQAIARIDELVSPYLDVQKG
jgi:hypothetical protein